MNYNAADKQLVSDCLIALVNSKQIKLDYEGDGDIQLECSSFAEEQLGKTVFRCSGFSRRCAVENALRVLVDDEISDHVYIRVMSNLQYEGANELVYKLDLAVLALAAEEVTTHEIFSRPEIYKLIRDNCLLEYTRAVRAYEKSCGPRFDPPYSEKLPEVPAQRVGGEV